MATVVITFFLSARFYVCKMDADFTESKRDQFLSRREQRWSMNSQRLEEIVAELMRPISDVRRSFDTDLSALLEEYLTEAGLHALEGGGRVDAPNFAELALLLQQSACIYGRKVDCLYQHVLSVSDALHANTLEISNTEEQPAADGAQTAAGAGRRKRKASALGEFCEIELEACAGARREAEAPRPPPTLPRMYIELEPRLITAADRPLCDYAGEPIGLLSDFQVTWRLHEGALWEGLQRPEGGEGARTSLRRVSLLELQAAIEAAAPAEPPPDPPATPPPETPPLGSSTPLPQETETTPETKAPLAKKGAKRRSDVRLADVFSGSVKMFIGEELLSRLREVREFSISDTWITHVVRSRKAHILAERKRLREQDEPDECRGFDYASVLDLGGFPGWSGAEAAAARAKSSRLESESDDDGFFEQSSVGDSDASRTDEPPATTIPQAEDSSSWAARVARSALGGARGVDVRALGAAVLRAAARAPPPAPAPFRHVLAEAAAEPADVSRLLLATLFLANAGNVEIVPGAPLSVDSFSVRVLSHDERLYAAAARDDEQFFR